MSRLPLLLFILLALVASACGSSDDSADEPETPTTVSQTTVSPTPVSPTTTVVATTTIAEALEPDEDAEAEPVTVAGFRDDIIGLLSGEGVLSDEEFERVFSPEFVALVSVEEFNSAWAQTAPLGPWRLVQTFGESMTNGAFLLEGSVPEPKLLLSVELEGGQVSDATIQPWAPPPESFDAAVAAVEALGTTRYLIAETTSGACVPIVDSGGEETIPLGSVFKLIVLGAVIDAIAEGTITWDDAVEIRDELDSYPSGTTQDVTAGTEMSVRELAELMISISDNTATDHLIDLVGRTQVEAAQSAYGVTQPELNAPFLTTRDLFQIKLNTELRERYLGADEAGRRLILEEVAELPLAPLEDVIGAWTGPIEVETLEWFATPADVCRALMALNADPDAAAILQINPGIPDDTDRWASIGFKGGSEPGVLATAWIVTDADGRTFTITGAAVSDGLIDDIAGALAFAGLRDQFEAP